ncbi:MAG: hypothetical protein U0894_02830 [Pirellulales bacterium]
MANAIGARKGFAPCTTAICRGTSPALFDAFDTVDICLELAAPLVAGAKLNVASINARLDKGYLDATTLMEYMILRGVPQRKAHPGR